MDYIQTRWLSKIGSSVALSTTPHIIQYGQHCELQTLTENSIHALVYSSNFIYVALFTQKWNSKCCAVKTIQNINIKRVPP